MSDEYRFFRDRVGWGPFTPVTATELDEIELHIGASLPEEYRRFIGECHGGNVDYSIAVPTSSGDQLLSFSGWFRVTPYGDDAGLGTLAGELRLLEQSYFRPGLPDHLLPIARDGGGSMLFLSLDPESFGRTYAFVHGRPGWAGGPEQDQVAVVTRNLDDYFDQLFIEDEIGELVWGDRTPEAEASIARWLDSGCEGWRDRPWARQGK